MARKSRGVRVGPEWLAAEGPGYPLVLSSRARLARNLEGLPFPAASGEEDLERARGMVLEAVSRRVAEERDWQVKFAEELTRDQLEILTEEYMTSMSFGDRPAGRALALRPEDGRSVVVNDEDHLRIQAVLPGSQFTKAWEIADRIDSQIESELQYSFDQQLGYLTASPSNVGTGLRLSAMLHLPALVITGDIAKTIAALGQAGIYVRGLYGEGSGVTGNLFQVANRQTLGRTEQDIVALLDMVVRQVADNERTARKMVHKESPLELADRVYRALGVVERARRIHFYEALELLSLVKLGAEMEVLPVKDFNMMTVAVGISPYHLRRGMAPEAGDDEIDAERAPALRRLLDL